MPGGKKVVKNDYRSSAKHVFSITPVTQISLIPSVATAPPGTSAWLRRPAGLPGREGSPYEKGYFLFRHSLWGYVDLNHGPLRYQRSAAYLVARK